MSVIVDDVDVDGMNVILIVFAILFV